MAKSSVSRKQLLKEPDQFITFSGKMIQYGRAHLKPILIGAGVVIGVLLILIAARQISEQNERQASRQVEKAVATYASALAETNSLEAYEVVKDDFDAIFDQYGSKVSGKLARILYGNISYAAKDADTAIAMYSQALEEFGNAPALKNILLSSLSHAYLLKDENRKALQTFEQISSGSEKTLKNGALFHLALLYDAAGDNKKSEALFEQLLVDFPASMYKDLVKEKINS